MAGRPHAHRRQRAWAYADHGLGHQLLLSRRSRKADRCRDRMGPEHGLPGIHRRAPGDGRDLDVGWPAHRSDRRPRGDVDRHDHRLGRAPRAFPGARPGELFRGLGGARRRHALLSLRRGVRGLGAGCSDARTQGHFVPNSLRRLCLDGVLGNRPLPERSLWLARDAHDLRGDQSRHLPAPQLDWSLAARGKGEIRLPPRQRRPRRMVPCSKGACALSALLFSHSSCRSTALFSASSRCSWCRCSRRRDSLGQRRCGSPLSRGMASSPAGSSKYFSGATSRRWPSRASPSVSCPPHCYCFLSRAGELWLLVAFTLLLGASQGVITIVRGAVPLALFGAKGYGAVLGVIATPILIVNAFSPAVFALVVDRFGWQISLYALLGCSMVTWVAIELMSRWYEGAQVRARGRLAREA